MTIVVFMGMVFIEAIVECAIGCVKEYRTIKKSTVRTKCRICIKEDLS